MSIEDTPILGPTSSPGHHQQTAWMMTFADLLSLILVFFVMLYAMTVLQTTEFEGVRDSLSQRLNPSEAIRKSSLPEEESIPRIIKADALNLDYLQTIVTGRLANLNQGPRVQIYRLDDRVVISMFTDTLFLPDSTTLRPGALTLLAQMAEALATLDNKIEIYGNLNPASSEGGFFTSKWEITLKQAQVIANYLRKSGYPHSIDMFGNADSRFADIPSGYDTPQRQALARRIDIAVRQTKAE